MDLSLIGPDRHEMTGLGRPWLALADLLGLAVGAAVAVAVIIVLAA
jgi:hypothetical protein